MAYVVMAHVVMAGRKACPDTPTCVCVPAEECSELASAFRITWCASVLMCAAHINAHVNAHVYPHVYPHVCAHV